MQAMVPTGKGLKTLGVQGSPLVFERLFPEEPYPFILRGPLLFYIAKPSMI